MHSILGLAKLKVISELVYGYPRALCKARTFHLRDAANTNKNIGFTLPTYCQPHYLCAILSELRVSVLKIFLSIMRHVITAK
jgi:hypothetical protein